MVEEKNKKALGRGLMSLFGDQVESVNDQKNLQQKNKRTTVVGFFKVKGHDRQMFYKVFRVLGAKKNPTRFSKYESA